MYKFKYLLLSSLLTLFLSFNAQASHLMGADITYQCLSPNKYKVIIKLYRDCRGIPLNSPDIFVFCDNVGAKALNCTRTSITDITPVCKTQTKPCSPQNDSTTNEGAEEHVYEGTLDLNIAPYNAFKNAGCCQIYIGIQQCCRNGAITTINPGNLWTEAMIDICNIAKTSNKCNTSPTLSNRPVIFACCNQPYRYSNGVYENTDGDSLSFDLTTPLNAHGSNESYQGNFNSQIPMTPYCPPNPGTINCKALPNAKPPRGFFFDELTGDIVFTPTNCGEVGVIVILVTEWRKDSTNQWLKIGTTRRDIEMIIKDCGSTNTPPYISNTINKYSVCEGTRLCFSITTADDNAGDTLDVKWLSSIPNATFRVLDTTALQKEIEFCWTPQIGDGRNNPYTFTVGVKDNHCPLVAEGSKSFNIFVKPRASAGRYYIRKASNKLVFQGISNNSNTYSWAFRDSADTTIFRSNNIKDSVTFSKKGKYTAIITVNNASNCPVIYYDTLLIDGSITTKVYNYAIKKVKVYPNPSHAFINIEYDETVDYKGLRILDLSGKELLKTAPLTQIDISQMSNGVYILEISTGEGNTYAKLIKQ